VKGINAAKAAGENPFPHKWHVSISLPAFVEKYSSLEVGTSEEGTVVSLAGARPARLWRLPLRDEVLACSARSAHALPCRARRPHHGEARERREAVLLHAGG